MPPATAADFHVLATKKDLVKSGEIVAWLKADFNLGHGHANAVAHQLDSESSKYHPIQSNNASGSTTRQEPDSDRR